MLTVLVVGAIAASVATETPAAIVMETPALAVGIETRTDGDSRFFAARVVARSGEPGGGTAVAFAVRRTFGLLPLGDEIYADEAGVSEVEFPAGLVGDTEGVVVIIVTVRDDATGETAVASAAVPWGRPMPDENPLLPRALWAPRAPWPLIALFIIIFGGIWSTYAFIVRQLWAIRKEGMS